MPDSQAQVRWAHAVLEGDAKGDRKFAREVVNNMSGRQMKELPQRKGPGRYRVPENRNE
jgi:hypothetical protein